MQIILDQNEIETAIRALVNEQVSVKDGHEITIDLKAGRGENGFSATIDIAPAGAKTDSTKPLGIEEKTSRAPRGQTNEVKAAPAKTTAAEAEPQAQPEPTPETAQEAASDAPTADSTDGGSEADAGDQSDAPAQDAAPEGAGTKGSSLFAGLGKPRNQ